MLKIIIPAILLSFNSFAGTYMPYGDCTFGSTRIIDADTIGVMNIKCVNNRISTFSHSYETSIRFNGIDTPEKNSKSICERVAAQASVEFFERISNGKKITVKNFIPFEGGFGRGLGDIYIDGRAYAPIAIEQGYGYQYNGKKKKKIDYCNR